MRRFKATPQKKLVGMLILFVLLPLFLLWYVIFFLDKRPGIDTIILIAAILLLAAYFYLRYKKQVKAFAASKQAGELPEQEEEFSEEEQVEESLEETE